MTTFLRRDSRRFKKFSKGKGKKAKWRNPTGRHNKIREGKKGYQPRVKIGYGNPVQPELKEIVRINNLLDLNKINKKSALLGKIGKKKKIEIAKAAKEKKIKFLNFNPDSFLRKEERASKKNKKEEKETEKKK